MKKNFVKALCMMGVMVCTISVFGETVSSPTEVTKQEMVITDPQQMYELGYAYLLGFEEGVPQDIKLARYWFEQASAKGYSKASYILGCMEYEGVCYDGVYVARNRLEAFKWFKKAGMQGDTDGMIMVATMYLLGHGVPKDIKNGIKWLGMAEQNDVAYASCAIGDTYRLEDFGINDINKAISYYNQSIKYGNYDGYFGLANIYFYGEGVKKDTAKGKQYYLKGAELGSPCCMVELDYLYTTGNFGKVDKKEALKWREKGAALNVPLALIEMGKMYDKGDGVPINKELAREYYKKAAKASDYYMVEGLVRCAQTYRDLKDKETALKSLEYYKKAANLGDAMSMLSVGVFYEKGYGVSVDLDEMDKWFQMAMSTRNPSAIQYLMERGFVIKQ